MNIGHLLEVGDKLGLRKVRVQLDLVHHLEYLSRVHQIQ